MKMIAAGACAALAMTLAAGPVLAASHTMENAAEKHKIALVEAFYDATLNQKDFDKAASYLAPTYTQHNPTAADGPEGLKGFITFLKTKFPDTHSEVKAAFADGDYVILHVWSVRTPGTKGTAIVDIFRLDHDKIAEHWDVRQDIPDTAANTNTMF